MPDPSEISHGEGGLGITRPTRKRLYHSTPGWVAGGAVFFITVCCKDRGRSQLDQSEAFTVIKGAIEHYVKTERWWCECFLAMPDHWHALLSFPDEERMDAVLRDWKRYVAKKTGVVWQDGFFDHRLRSAENTNATWLTYGKIR